VNTSHRHLTREKRYHIQAFGKGIIYEFTQNPPSAVRLRQVTPFPLGRPLHDGPGQILG